MDLMTNLVEFLFIFSLIIDLKFVRHFFLLIPL